MLVYEFKLKGKPHQYQAIDEAIRIVQFMRNKAVRYWMDHRGSGKHDLYKLAASHCLKRLHLQTNSTQQPDSKPKG